MVFAFQAPHVGIVDQFLHLEGETVAFCEPVMKTARSDLAGKGWVPPVLATSGKLRPAAARAPTGSRQVTGSVFLGVGGYLPRRVVTNGELVEDFAELTEQYVYQVTGIQERRWADADEKPSDMAHAAALEAISHSGVDAAGIDAVIVATTTPDAAMPSTASILQDHLGLRNVPAFDLNAACSGWMYAVSMARGMIAAAMAENVLVVGVDMQSRLLDRSDRNTCFLFGDGAGAAVIGTATTGHRIRRVQLGADTRGLAMARREQPGYEVAGGTADPWIRVDGHAMFRFATESFAGIIRQAAARTGWNADEITWVVPHQANGRILKAAAKRSGIPFERFYLNVHRVGNTSSASIPLALLELEDQLRPGDKLVLCSVGAGVTTAAITVEW